MSALGNLKARWGANRSHRKMERAYIAFEPYLHLLETPNGMWAMVLVSGMAALVTENRAAQWELEQAIALGSAQSGIPAPALAAHAEMLLACAIDQKNAAH